jgi:hypothetical protein
MVELALLRWCVAGLAFAPQDSAPDAARVPSTTRLHPIGVLLSTRKGSWKLDLCPSFGRFADSQEDGDAVDRDADSVIDLRSLKGFLEEGASRPPFYEDWEIETAGRDLRVTGPEWYHAQVDALLDGLAAGLSSEVEVEVRVLEGTDADGRGTTLRSDVAHVNRAASPAIWDQDERRCIQDWEVEIAHGGVIGAPIVRSVSTGLVASLRATRLRGATWLDLAIRYDAPIEPMRERTLLPKIWLSAPVAIRPDQTAAQERHESGGTVVTGPIPRRVQFPSARFVACAGSFVVADGQALRIPCSVATKSGPAAFTLDVRARMKEAPFVHRVARPPKTDAERVFVRVDAFTPRRLVAPPFGTPAFLDTWPPPDEGGWPSQVGLEVGNDNPAEAILRRAIDPAELVSVDFSQPLPDLLLLQTPEPLPDSESLEIEKAVEDASAALASPQFDLDGTILDGDAAVAHFRLPVIGGRVASLWSGATYCGLDATSPARRARQSGRRRAGSTASRSASRVEPRAPRTGAGRGERRASSPRRAAGRASDGKPDHADLRGPAGPPHRDPRDAFGRSGRQGSGGPIRRIAARARAARDAEVMRRWTSRLRCSPSSSRRIPRRRCRSARRASSPSTCRFRAAPRSSSSTSSWTAAMDATSRRTKRTRRLPPAASRPR